MCSSFDVPAGGWSLVLREDYPVVRREERSREEVLGDELSYYLRQLVWDRRGEETVVVNLEELLVFDGVSRITQDVKEVGRVLGERGLKVDIIKGVVVAEEEREESRAVARLKCLQNSGAFRELFEVFSELPL